MYLIYDWESRNAAKAYAHIDAILIKYLIDSKIIEPGNNPDPSNKPDRKDTAHAPATAIAAIWLELWNSLKAQAPGPTIAMKLKRLITMLIVR